MAKRPILITGAAGFIGAALVKELLLNGEKVIGIDNLNNYYDVNLKKSRLDNINRLTIANHATWRFEQISINDFKALSDIFESYSPRIVVNLAAQAGVRHSMKFPSDYIQSNIVGFTNLIELCKTNNIENLIYASSSSVYGGNENYPFSEKQSVDHPISLYAATKKSNELIAHTYSHLYGIPSTGLRFFTVYGPWGRPDMAPMIFAKSILSREPISIYNHGEMKRDFTYIDDVTEAIKRCCYQPATSNPNFNKNFPDPSTSFAPHRIFNIGNSNSIPLMEFIKTIEDYLEIKAIKHFMPIQPGDVISTASDNKALESWIGFKPSTSLKIGISKFIDWYKEYYDIN